MFSLVVQGAFVLAILFGPFLSTEAAAVPRFQSQDPSLLGVDVSIETTHYATFQHHPEVIVTHDKSRPSWGLIDVRKREVSVTKVRSLHLIYFFRPVLISFDLC